MARTDWVRSVQEAMTLTVTGTVGVAALGQMAWGRPLAAAPVGSVTFLEKAMEERVAKVELLRWKRVPLRIMRVG